MRQPQAPGQYSVKSTPSCGHSAPHSHRHEGGGPHRALVGFSLSLLGRAHVAKQLLPSYQCHRSCWSGSAEPSTPTSFQWFRPAGWSSTTQMLRCLRVEGLQQVMSILPCRQRLCSGCTRIRCERYDVCRELYPSRCCLHSLCHPRAVSNSAYHWRISETQHASVSSHPAARHPSGGGLLRTLASVSVCAPPHQPAHFVVLQLDGCVSTSWTVSQSQSATTASQRNV